MARWTNEQDRTAALLVVMMVLPTVAIIIRAWACFALKDRRVGLDDAFAFAALPFALATNGVFLWWVTIGLGRHANQVPPAELLRSTLVIYIAELLYDWSISLPKLSVLFFYHRVFKNTSKTFRNVLLLLGFMVTGWLIGSFFSSVFQCSPIQAGWDASVQGDCIGQWGDILGTAIPSVLIDVLILLAPLPKLWQLRMSTSRKLFVIGVFVIGYSVVVCSIGRLVTLAKLGNNYESDIDWLVVPYIEWVASEGPVSIICVSLPTIYHYLKHVLAKNNGSTLTTVHTHESQRSTFANWLQRLKAKLALSRPMGEKYGASSTKPVLTYKRTTGAGLESLTNSQVRIDKHINVFEEPGKVSPAYEFG